VVSTLARSLLRLAQTPQGFVYNRILDAHRRATDNPRLFVDDAEVYAAIFQKSPLVPNMDPEYSLADTNVLDLEPYAVSQDEVEFFGVDPTLEIGSRIISLDAALAIATANKGNWCSPMATERILEPMAKAGNTPGPVGAPMENRSRACRSREFPSSILPGGGSFARSSAGSQILVFGRGWHGPPA